MKFFGILIALLPALTYSVCPENDPFGLTDLADDFFSHIEFENEEMGEFQEGRDVLEVESLTNSTLHKAIDLAADEGISNFVERRATEINEDYEEFLGYAFPKKNDVVDYAPSMERIPEQKRQLIGSRPRVIQDGTKEVRTLPLASKKGEKKSEQKEIEKDSR